MRQTLGDRHPDTLNAFYNLAGLQLAQGPLTVAEPLFREELADSAKLLAPAIEIR